MYALHFCERIEENGKVTFTGKCVFTGKSYSVTVSKAQLDKYNKGALVQDAFRFLSADDREFLISGVSPEGWCLAFPSSDNME